METKTKVLKFGGSTYGKDLPKGLEKIEKVLSRESRTHDEIIVVVSAFLGRTRELRTMGEHNWKKPKTKEMDAFISQGEKESSEFLYNHLLEEGYNVALLGVDSIPIITDESFGEAEILFVDKDAINGAIDKALRTREILVIPGFIGRTIFDEITTLGNDGSDTTAVYLAGTKKCDCELFKDVNGIYTANPRKVEKATKIGQLNIDDALKLAMLGSNVVHPKALSAAKMFGIDISVKPHFYEGTGTLITNDVPPAKIAGITYVERGGKMIVSIVGTDIPNIDVIKVKTAVPGTFSFAVSKEELEEALVRIHTLCGLDNQNDTSEKFIGNGK